MSLEPLAHPDLVTVAKRVPQGVLCLISTLSFHELTTQVPHMTDIALENLERVIREVCAADVEADGMEFDPATVKTERIKEDADYEGVRVRFVGLLGKARVAMQIDVGFGDVITPGAQDITYPVLLDFLAPALSGYPRETVVAEKFQAMVYLSTLNSRMKDFYDVWLLARQFAFDGALLAKAIAATFANRETAIDVAPIAFTPKFTEQRL